MFTEKELEAIRYIRSFIMNSGHMPSIRQMGREIGFSSPRSASVMFNKLVEKGVLQRKENGAFRFADSEFNHEFNASTVDVPLVGTVSCGAPVFAEENIEAMIPVSAKLAKSPHKYFLLRASGDSMNQKGINDGDLVLVRRQETAVSKDIIVALIDGEATVKEFKKIGDVIILFPRSDNPRHKPIYLERDFRVQGIVVATIPKE